MSILKPGSDWASTVVRRRYVPVAHTLELVKRANGYRLCVRSAHRAWELAVGVDRMEFTA